MNTDTLRLVRDDDERAWLVCAAETPIGAVCDDGRVLTPSGATYTVREGRGAARLWSADGKPVVNYDREPILHVKDVASGVVWDLRPNWLEAARGAENTLDVAKAFAREYTLEEAQGTAPARVQLLLAYLALKNRALG